MFKRLSNPELVDLLSATKLLRGLPSATLWALVKSARPRELEDEGILWTQSQHQEHDQDLALIENGVLRIESIVPPRDESDPDAELEKPLDPRIFRLAASGELLGITTCLGSGKHAVQVRAHRGPATLWMFPGSKVREIARNHVAVFERALNHACTLVSKLNRHLHADRLPAVEHLREALPMLALPEKTELTTHRIVRMTREEICAALGRKTVADITTGLVALERERFLVRVAKRPLVIRLEEPHLPPAGPAEDK